MAEMVTVAINGREVTYHLVETTAPRAYDYGGVLEYYDNTGCKEGGRYILVPADILAMQEGRNRSGLYAFAPSGDVPSSAIGEDIWNKLHSAFEPT